jgi:Asp-tRNA(Asn)/Glu-tRNA(Gln) amidotransferase B subunit
MYLKGNENLADWELGVYAFWNWAQDSDHPVAQKIVADGIVRYLAYALDMLMVVDSGLADKIDEMFAANKEMVDKARKNDKLEGWFVGQLMKGNRQLDPKLVAQTVHERLRMLI